MRPASPRPKSTSVSKTGSKARCDGSPRIATRMPRPAQPEAPRRIAIAGQEVDYHLRRSRRRTIGLTIDQRGLRVGAPLQARLGDIESLIRQHGEWVLAKLAAWRERPAAEKLAVTDGTVISALGAALTVTVTPGSRQRWLFSGD